MKIPESKIAEISSAADIVQVISEYVDLKRAGKDYRGLCPFHGDKDPSFYVSPQKGIFHCFGCAVGGSVFTFVMKMENTTFVEAARLLAKRYGIPFALEGSGGRSEDEKARLGRALEAASRYFVDRLAAHGIAQDYLRQRGISDEWVRQLGLGFAPDSWEGLEAYLRKAGVDVRDAVAVGLLKPRTSGGYYDAFRSRIMIPIHDLNGRVVGFGGRIVGDGEPKYLNSPESPLFRKKGILYGLDTAREAIKRGEPAVLVEGYFDQISLRIRGMENVAAPLGTALGLEQIRLLKRFTEDIITVFDGDEAGLRAVKRSIPIFLSEGIEPRCLILKEDKDPDEAVNRLGMEGFRQLLETSVSMIDHLLETLENKFDTRSLRGRNLALAECLPVLREIADSRERDYLIERFSWRLRIGEDRLRRMLRSSPRPAGRDADTPSDARRSLFDFPPDERNVVRGMLIREGFIDRVVESGVLKDLEDKVLKDLAFSIVEFRDATGQFDSAAFCNSLEDQNPAALVAAWLKPRPEEDDLRPEVDGDRTLDESLDRIRLRKLDTRKTEIKERMKNCLAGGEEYNSLAQELWAIGRRLRK